MWIGIINASNISGTKATDDAKLTELTKKLQDMLLARRLNGNLSREEFAAVADDVVVPPDGRERYGRRHRSARASDERRAAAVQDCPTGRRARARAVGQLTSTSRTHSRGFFSSIETGIFTAVPNGVAALYSARHRSNRSCERSSRTGRSSPAAT